LVYEFSGEDGDILVGYASEGLGGSSLEVFHAFCSELFEIVRFIQIFYSHLGFHGNVASDTDDLLSFVSFVGMDLDDGFGGKVLVSCSDSEGMACPKY